jgi:hypothetical protein
MCYRARVERRIVKVLRAMPLSGAAREDARDAVNGNSAERFEAMEELRRMYFGYDDNPPGLVRLLERASLGEHKVSSDWRPRPRVPR